MKAPLLEPGSAVAAATLQLMLGERTVSLTYRRGADRYAELATILGHLLSSEPNQVFMSMPVPNRPAAVRASRELQDALDTARLPFVRQMTEHEVVLTTDYEAGLNPERVFIDFTRLDDFDFVSAEDLLVIDAGRAGVALQMSGRMRARQVLLLGSRGNPNPTFGSRKGWTQTPWGDPPFEVVLAGGAS